MYSLVYIVIYQKFKQNVTSNFRIYVMMTGRTFPLTIVQEDRQFLKIKQRKISEYLYFMKMH